ncbi:MAG: hypothetical protein JKY65_13830, partial [Planctomycetes bacterium]|nr:hypothetical protein [Planctomycetota bacterium]
LVWRGVTLVGLSLLACNALWIGGGLPTPLALAPLVLVGVAVASHLVRAWGGEVSPHFAHLPAVCVGIGTFCQEGLNAGLPLSRSHALVLLMLVAAASLPLLVRARHSRRLGARSLAVAAAAAPLASLSATGALLYLLLIGSVCLVWSLVLRKDAQATVAGVAVTTLIMLLNGGVTALAIYGALLATAIAIRPTEGKATPGLAYLLTLAPGPVVCLLGSPELAKFAALLAAGGAGLLLAHRQQAKIPIRLAWVSLAIVIGRKATVGARPAYVLLGLAFAGIPLGTWLGLRREAEARAADAALLEDPRFEGPPEPARVARPVRVTPHLQETA